MINRGFGKGNYVGIGGKVEPGETDKQGAVREITEEIGVTLGLDDLRLIATLYFYFPHIVDESWNQVVRVFLADGTGIEPTESDEIRPEWKLRQELPELYEQAWDDARYWWQQALTTDEEFVGEFLFDQELKVVEHRVSDSK